MRVRLVKKLSGRLARKLQRGASLVKAGLSAASHTVVDAATVDRCDSVEICCSDAPCLTGAMQHQWLASFSLLRTDSVGNHDAQTRGKLLAWLVLWEPISDGVVRASCECLSEQFYMLQSPRQADFPTVFLV